MLLSRHTGHQQPRHSRELSPLLTLHVAGDLAEEHAEEPGPVDDVTDEEGDTEDRGGEVGHGEVDKEHVLRLAHVSVAEDGGNEEGIAGDGDEGDGCDEGQQRHGHLEEEDRCQGSYKSYSSYRVAKYKDTLCP